MENFSKEIFINADVLREYYVVCQNTIDAMPDEIVITEEDMAEH
jgi:hypothetical protein